MPAPLVAGGAIAGFARSADGGSLPTRARRRCILPPLFAARGDGSGERPIESLNRALLARHAFGAVREFTVKGWGGERVQMFVAYPPNFDPAKKWPLMHSVHGGPHAAHLDSWHFRWNAHVFAGQGYVVPAVNYHGSSGFGQKFIESITGRYGAEGVRRRRGGDGPPAADRATSTATAWRHRRQLRRLHGRVHERPHEPLSRVSSATPAATTGSA